MKLIVESYSDISTGTESDEGVKNYYIQGIYAQAELKNKNGRVYPIEYLKEAIDIYRKDFINLDKSYQECDHPCFSKSANILTVNGWKSIVDVEVGELVYTLDPDTLETVVKPVREKVVKPFKGKMIRLKNRTLNTLVTPDHRFPTYNGFQKLVYRTASEIKELLNNNSLSYWVIPKSSNTDPVLPDSKGQGIYLDNKHLSATEEDFDDLVYCINVDNTSFYASDNEYSFWSGNCYPEIRLSNCCARVISLEQSGNDWLGKSIVFNGGKGEIIKTIIDSKSRLSVSTRALGEVVKTESTEYVKRGMILTAIDVVADASAPNAFVRGILEGRNFSYIPINGNVIDSINTKYKADVKEKRQQRFDRGSERILIEQLEHLIKKKLKAL